MQTIEVTITPDGDTTVEVKGCAGPSCQSLTAAIERAIGKTTADMKKPEYHRSAQQEQQQEQR